MKLARKQILNILEVLNQLKNEKFMPIMAHKLVKNRKLAEEEKKIMIEARDQTDFPTEINDFHKERIKMCTELCEKDSDGNPKMQPAMGPDGEVLKKPNGEVEESFILSQEATNIIKEKLQELEKEEKYALAFKRNEEIEKSFSDLLDQEVTIGLSKICVKDLPNVTMQQIEILEPILEDDDQ